MAGYDKEVGRAFNIYDGDRWLKFLDDFYPIPTKTFREVSIPERIRTETHRKTLAIIKKYFGQKPLFISLFSFYQRYEPTVVDRIWWDIDNMSLKNARIIAESVASIGETYVFFSGNKGFHIYLFGVFDWEEATTLWKAFSKYSDKTYDKARVVRIPFTMHEKSGRFVVPVHPEDTIKEVLNRGNNYMPPLRYSQLKRYRW